MSPSSLSPPISSWEQGLGLASVTCESSLVVLVPGPRLGSRPGPGLGLELGKGWEWSLGEARAVGGVMVLLQCHSLGLEARIQQ